MRANTERLRGYAQFLRVQTGNSLGREILLARETPPSANASFDRAKQKSVKKQAEGDGQDHNADDLGGIVKFSSHVKQVAKTHARLDQLGRDGTVPSESPTQLQAGDDARQGRWNRHTMVHRPRWGAKRS